MKKRISLKTFVLFSSLGVLSTYGVLLACADYFWGYDYSSNFTPEAFVEKTYSPLFFAPDEPFYGIGFDENYTSRFNESIVNDWSRFLQGKLANDKLEYLLLNDSNTTTINQVYSFIQQKQKLPDQLNYINVGDERVRNFIEFMYHAKRIEAGSTASLSSWDYEEAKDVPAVSSKTIAEVEKLYAQSKDPYLKNRYWFQTMKAYFYSANKQDVITFFDKTKAATPVNTLYYRGLSYVAGAYYSRKDYTTSNYYFSTVFDKCPELRTVTAYNFHPQEDADFEGALAMAKTAEEKTSLWALLGFYGDEKRSLQEIYKLNPTSPHLDYLLTRLINKEEARLNEYAFASADDYRASMKNMVNKEVLQFVTRIADENRTGKPLLWNSAAAYLHMFAGNQKLTNQYVAKAGQVSEKTPLAKDQLRLLKLVNTLVSTTKMDASSEASLLPELNWLYKTCTNTDDETFRYRNALQWSKRYLSSLYQSQHNLVMAELFNRQETFYQSESNLEAMKTFLSNPPKSAFEQLAMELYDVTLSDIYEYQSIKSAYAEQLDKAIALMENSEKGKQVELLGNPFNGKIKDCHDCDHAANQRVTYTKLSLLLKMKEMHDHIEKGEDVYNNSLLLANAYYNMTYFGNARVFYYSTIVNQYGNYIAPYYQSQLLSCQVAGKYYQKAFDAAVNNEQRAKCSYMLAKCERNEFYTKMYHSKDDFYDNTEVDYLAWAGFKKLKTEYADTKYYQEVIRECGYFKKYAESR